MLVVSPKVSTKTLQVLTIHRNFVNPVAIGQGRNGGGGNCPLRYLTECAIALFYVIVVIDL